MHASGNMLIEDSPTDAIMSFLTHNQVVVKTIFITLQDTFSYIVDKKISWNVGSNMIMPKVGIYSRLSSLLSLVYLEVYW